MHTYFISRAIFNEARDFITDLQAQYFNYPCTVDFARKCNLPVPSNLSGGQMVNIAVQLAVRPIQLWEVVYPKECYQEVMNTIFPNGIKVRPEFSFPLGMIRKTLGARKCPPVIPGNRRIVRCANVATYPIGVRADHIDPVDGHEHL